MVNLYNYSLLPSSAITASCVGNFSGTKQQEICVARGGTRLELLRTDAQTGKLESIVEADVFGQIRSLCAFKLTGGSKGASSHFESSAQDRIPLCSAPAAWVLTHSSHRLPHCRL